MNAPRETTPNLKTALGVFGTTFGAIFLAEFGDKTQLALLLMTAESQSPWVVFTGA
ncbi:MAG: TMEM165/GDT1 family protein, partial [Cyanobacteria bacterium P01_H01_bin.130]